MAITMETRAPPGSTPDVSLLAFLRAHRRIKDGGGAKVPETRNSIRLHQDPWGVTTLTCQEMEGCSGHLCALLGCLYKGADGSGCTWVAIWPGLEEDCQVEPYESSSFQSQLVCQELAEVCIWDVADLYRLKQYAIL